jgi:hypothetical protein
LAQIPKLIVRGSIPVTRSHMKAQARSFPAWALIVKGLLLIFRAITSWPVIVLAGSADVRLVLQQRLVISVPAGVVGLPGAGLVMAPPA